jgi:hypothetical protein
MGLALISLLLFFLCGSFWELSSHHNHMEKSVLAARLLPPDRSDSSTEDQSSVSPPGLRTQAKFTPCPWSRTDHVCPENRCEIRCLKHPLADVHPPRLFSSDLHVPTSILTLVTTKVPHVTCSQCSKCMTSSSHHSAVCQAGLSVRPPACPSFPLYSVSFLGHC